MFSAKKLITVEFDSTHLANLKEFCEQCSMHGYINNASVKAIKLDWCLDVGGQFFLTYLDDKLISLSGCHPLPEAGENCYRSLFRGVTLPEYQNLFKVVSKTHMSSIPFFDHLPLQIAWAAAKGHNDIVVTTNWSNPDNIESMNRSHRVFHSLEKQNIVTCMHRKINIFNTEQSVWKINREQYSQARAEFRDRHGLY